MKNISSKANPTLIASGYFGLPRINVPASVITDEQGRITFDIETSSGNIQVRGWHGWECSGNPEALAAARLLQPSWLPGIQGNNKGRQRVLFEQSGPRLVTGNLRGTSLEAPTIVITRPSKCKYCVWIPPTKAQASMLDAARDQYWKHRQAEREREEKVRREQEEKAKEQAIMIRQKRRPAHEVRENCFDYVALIRKMILRELESSSFRPSASMAQKLEENFSNLKHCLMNGAMVSEHGDQANIIALHNHTS